MFHVGDQSDHVTNLNMAVFTKEVSLLTTNLIQTITGFLPGEENYNLCFEFCRSNIKYHRYLDVDSYKVTRSIENLGIKFKVHSQPEKAKHLKSATEHFLSLGSNPKSDSHYSVLLFLLCVSSSPTNAEYTPPRTRVCPPVAPIKDDFDWSAYLMEGIEIPSFSDTSSDDLSNLTDEDTSDKQEEDLSHSDLGEELSDETYEQKDPLESQSLKWLTDHVTPVYWDHSSVHWSHDSHMISCHPVCNLLSNCGYSNIPLTEIQIVRETLWMLLGAEGGCVYIHNKENEEIGIAPDVALSHTTPGSLHKALDMFSKLGSQLKTIRVLIEKSILSADVNQISQSSANFLKQFIMNVNKQLQVIERSLVDKKRFVSLLILMNELRLLENEVACVYSVVKSCDNQCILDVLWNHMDFYDTMHNSTYVNILFPWFITTSQPYLVIMNKWMTQGQLIDPSNEFCVKRNCEVSKSWKDAFHLDNVPLFIQDMSNKVLVSGKSCFFMEAVNKMSPDIKGPSLYNEFVDMFINKKEGEDDEEDDEEEYIPPSMESCSLVLTNTDPVLCHTLQQIRSESSYHSNHRLFTPALSTDFNLPQDNYPLTHTIRKSLQTCIQNRFIQATTSLINTLKVDFRLLDHFRQVRLFLLMEAGDIMHNFTSLLFNRMMSGESWLESSFLNSILQEALQYDYKHMENMLFIQLKSDIPSVVSLDTLAAISLHYKVAWPLEVLFAKELMNVYNQIFTFLLQVKLAKWCLTEIDVGRYRGYCGKDPVKLHKLFLLKAKLLHFVSCLNHYLLTRILHSSGIEFQEYITQANDLDTIICSHVNYVNSIHDRCLLNRKAHFVKEAIMKTLRLTITFYNTWMKGVEHFSWHEGRQIEKEFSRCSHFLISCLNTHVKRGSFPHLETLAFSLMSLSKSQKIFP